MPHRFNCDTDTIVAVATPLGRSPRAICRLSGPEAVALAGRLFEPGEGRTLDDAGIYVAIPGTVRLGLRSRCTTGSPPACCLGMRPMWRLDEARALNDRLILCGGMTANER